MEREAVSSLNLSEIGYDPASETLEVMFHHGGVYQYYNVPFHVYEQLRNAPSIGKFFNAEIKGRFPEARV